MAQRTFDASVSINEQLNSLSQAVDGLLADYAGMIGSGLEASHAKALGNMAQAGYGLIRWGESFPQGAFLPVRILLLPYIIETTAQAVDMLLVEQQQALFEEQRQLTDRLSAIENERLELRSLGARTKWGNA